MLDNFAYYTPPQFLKAPITTAADNKFCDIFPNFRQKRYITWESSASRRFSWNMPFLLFLKKRQNLQFSSAGIIGGALRVNLQHSRCKHQKASSSPFSKKMCDSQFSSSGVYKESYSLPPGKFFPLFCRLLIFSKSTFSKNSFSVKQFGSRSGPTFCRDWSGSNLFAKVISRRH